jgi:hypothetical protein
MSQCPGQPDGVRCNPTLSGSSVQFCPGNVWCPGQVPGQTDAGDWMSCGDDANTYCNTRMPDYICPNGKKCGAGPSPPPPPSPPCVPKCSSACGGEDDGCSGRCPALSSCQGRQCGPPVDRSGTGQCPGSCGTCKSGTQCSSSGVCVSPSPPPSPDQPCPPGLRRHASGVCGVPPCANGSPKDDASWAPCSTYQDGQQGVAGWEGVCTNSVSKTACNVARPDWKCPGKDAWCLPAGKPDDGGGGDAVQRVGKPAPILTAFPLAAYNKPVNLQYVSSAVHPKRIDGYRAMLVCNRSGHSLFVGLQGNVAGDAGKTLTDHFKFPDLTGWELADGKNALFYLPEGLSGRLWPRNNCRWVAKKDGTPFRDSGGPDMGQPVDSDMLVACHDPTDPRANCTVACDVGNCMAGPGLTGRVACGDIGGESPLSLFEWTFEASQDYVDMSAVDGYSYGLRAEAIDGALFLNAGHKPVAALTMQMDADDVVHPTDPRNRCPLELQYKDSAGNYFCSSIGKSLVGSHIAQVSDPKAKEWLTRNSGDAPGPVPGTFMRDFLACACSGGAACDDPSSTGYCCSPYRADYPETEPFKNKRCLAQTHDLDNYKRQRTDTDGNPVYRPNGSWGLSNAEIAYSNGVRYNPHQQLMTELPNWPPSTLTKTVKDRATGKDKTVPVPFYDYFVPKRLHDEYGDITETPPWYIWQFSDERATYGAVRPTGYKITILPPRAS